MGRSTDAGVAKTGSARKPTTILLPKRDRRVFRLRSLAVLSSALIVLAGATAGGAKAFTPGAGAWYLQYGHCCSGAKLEGTQAKIAGFTQSPESNQCIDYSSGVVAANGDRFIGT